MCELILMGLMALSVGAPGAEPAAREDPPYRVLVAMRFSEDRIFTPVFVDSVQRQVRDQLRNYFGGLADVQVATGHPLFTKLASQGLGSLALASPQFADLKGLDKVFLLAVDYDEGIYRIQSRQIDREVQDVGLLQIRSSPDRQWLAKVICLAVKEDFAPVATVEPPRAGKPEADLRFHGAEQHDRLSAWLQKGCVLQVFRLVHQSGGTLKSERMTSTLLHLADNDGKRATVLVSRGNPWEQTARIAGFRAIKLTTRKGRFRLRLLDAETGRPVQDCPVYANNSGFDPSERDRLLRSDVAGWVADTHEYDQVAFITIRPRSDAGIQILLPMTAEWVEQVCRIAVDPQAREKNDWHRRVRYCAQDVQTLQGCLEEVVRDINRLTESKRYEEALQRANDGANSLQPLVDTTSDRMRDLAGESKSLQFANSALLDWASHQLEDAKNRHAELRKLVQDLEETIKEVNARNRAKVLSNLARQAENAGEIDEAIKQYAAALKEWPDPATQKHLDQLSADWKIKTPEHQVARKFVFERLTAVQKAEELDRLLPEAELALATLRQVDDRLSLRKMMTLIGNGCRELADIVDALAGRDSEEDRREYEKFDKLTRRVVQFHQQILDCLNVSRPTQPASPPAGEPNSESRARPEGQTYSPAPANRAPATGLDHDEESPLDPKKASPA